MENKKILYLFFVIVGMVVLGGAIIFFTGLKKPASPTTPTNNSVTPTPLPQNPPPVVADQAISDGTIKISFLPQQFGLAINSQQVLVAAYIPPCDEDFTYCLYYIGQEYQGTNFESAGVRIKKRTDLSSESKCLTTFPVRYDSIATPTSTYPGIQYAGSVFYNIGDAAAGHYSSGSVYRLFVAENASCYEFQTRIGESQFQNYPTGTIKEFTDADRATVEASLKQIIGNISLPSGQKLFDIYR